MNGTEETAITDTGYTQGIPVWSYSGKQIVYIVGAIGNEGKYDIYLMNSDGSENRNITPDYFPALLRRIREIAFAEEKSSSVSSFSKSKT